MGKWCTNTVSKHNPGKFNKEHKAFLQREHPSVVGLQPWWIVKEQLTSSTWTCGKHDSVMLHKMELLHHLQLIQINIINTINIIIIELALGVPYKFSSCSVE